MAHLEDALGIGRPQRERRLDARDEAVRRLARVAGGDRTRQSRIVAGWLARAKRGDELLDLTEEARALVATVGELSWRQIFRILGGNRAGDCQESAGFDNRPKCDAITTWLRGARRRSME